MELLNKVCLVAGASGAIGSAIACRFHQEGARLALSYSKTKPERLCEKLSAGPSRVACYRLDVADWQQVRDAVDRIEADFQRIDVVVNCAGIVGPIGPLETLNMRDWTKTVEVNLLGSVHLARAVLPDMKERGRGKIILFSGGGAAYGRPFFTAYSSSKAALVRFAESLAQELEGTNIQVNAVAPGPVKSRMWEELRAAGDKGGTKALEELKQMDETGGVPPDLAAELAVFLASERSNRLTGRLISAVHDKWNEIETRIPQLISGDAWTLRRVPLD
jgi:NAD(P)-dependent dehydrogenase (short-subunit alcohol dehydrogenase family)